jgi:hypothetical protein
VTATPVSPRPASTAVAANSLLTSIMTWSG